MLLSLALRNDNMQFGCFPEARTHQPEISYTAHVHVKWTLAKFTDPLFVVQGFIFLKGSSTCQVTTYIVASYRTNSGILNCQKTDCLFFSCCYWLAVILQKVAMAVLVEDKT